MDTEYYSKQILIWQILLVVVPICFYVVAAIFDYYLFVGRLYLPDKGKVGKQIFKEILPVTLPTSLFILFLAIVAYFS